MEIIIKIDLDIITIDLDIIEATSLEGSSGGM